MYLNFRYFFRLTSAYIRRFKGLIFVSILFGIGGFALLNNFLFPALNKKVTVIGITGRYTTDNIPLTISNLLSSGLTKIDENGIIQPGLSSDWTYDENGKIWTFTLKEDSRWHDGTVVKSSDLSYKFLEIDVQFPDDKTIKFNLKNKFAPLPAILSKPVFKNGYIGTGEWKVKSVILNGSYLQKIIIVSKDESEIIYKFYPTDDRTKLAYKLGEVSQIDNMLDPAPFSNWDKKVNLERFTNYDQVVTLFFNTKNGILEDKSLRQALNYAIDKNSLGERAISPISPKSYFYNPQVKRYDYDTDRVKELLKDVPKESLEKMAITLVTSPDLLDISENIANSWDNIGINTQVLVSSIVPEDFQAYVTILDIPKDPDQYPLWHSTQDVSNLSNYSSPRIDKILEDGRNEYDIEKRKELYFDFQRFINEDTPAIFIIYPNYYNITRP